MKNPTERQATLSLSALAMGAFGIGTTEFAPMGMLPTISESLHVSIERAGLLVSIYAIGVAVGAPLMTLALYRLSRRTALPLLMAIFVAGNLLAAFSPSYALLVLARAVTSLAHGAFFGLGAVVAASLRPTQPATGVATMFLGLTIANVGGVPAAAWIGQTWGWHLAFLGIASIGVLAMAALLLTMKRDLARGRPSIAREVSMLAQGRVLHALLTTVVGATAMFTLYTYVVPVLNVATKRSDDFIVLALVLIGIGFTIGNRLGGWLADRSAAAALKILFALLAVVMALMPLVLASSFALLTTILVWAAVAFALVPVVQIRVMDAASDAPTLSSAINIAAFNIGNALGAAVGAAVLADNVGYQCIPIVGALVAAVGLVLVWRPETKSKDLVEK
jgi:MFS transporter, DHA1 family, inner membrane transport protein